MKAEIRDERLDAEREARRRVALASIRQYPDPVLRMRARDVEQFDANLARLVDRMKTLMSEANGVGLAANQVGVLQRLFVFHPDEGEEPTALVNPRVVGGSDEVAADDEGCLSLQGVVVPVERRTAVTIEARDVRGDELRLELSGLPGRVVQHELDHLDGVLILDRTTQEHRREALARLRPQPVLGAAR